MFLKQAFRNSEGGERSTRANRRRVILVNFFVAPVLILLLGALAPAANTARYEIGHTSRSFSGSRGSTGDLPVEIYYPAERAGTDAQISSGDFPVIVFAHGYHHIQLLSELYETFNISYVLVRNYHLT